MGALSSEEYCVLTSWYEWLEKKADIDLDLIGEDKFCTDLHFTKDI